LSSGQQGGLVSLQGIEDKFSKENIVWLVGVKGKKNLVEAMWILLRQLS
jgi:hypothetical protein